MKAAGTPVVELKKKEEFSCNEIKSSIIKEYGAFYFYQEIAKKTGLLKIIQDVFPKNWQEIFALAGYLISSGDPMMYCRDWVEKTDCYPVDLDSRRISELLRDLQHEKLEEFFRVRGAYRREREYLALDITSISSYSNQIETVEWGYNRDGEKLPQINLCMLLGEKSRLPVYQHWYSGSIKDVSTLEASLKLAFSISRRRLALVMDKGFYSKKNLKTLLEMKFSGKFLMAVPFTVKKAKDLVTELKGTIEKVRYAIALSRSESIQGVCREMTWEDGQTVYAHVCYNMIKAVEEKAGLYGYVAALENEARIDSENKKHLDDFNHYLTIKKSSDGKISITRKQSVIDEETARAGWMVLISNQIKDTKKSLSIYRAKDAVEKGFFRIKNNLDLQRLRVHSNDAVQGKLFIGFISLIVMSHIHQVMTTEKLYKSVTLIELIKQMEKLRVQYISGNRILFPLTKYQKMILDIFQLKVPA